MSLVIAQKNYCAPYNWILPSPRVLARSRAQRVVLSTLVDSVCRVVCCPYQGPVYQKDYCSQFVKLDYAPLSRVVKHT